MKVLSCDFETNNDKEQCRVWLYGIYDIYTEKFEWGKNVSEFLDRIMQCSNDDSVLCSFHNLKFDGEFFTIEMLKRGWELVKESKVKLKFGQFRTCINHMGEWFLVEIGTMSGHNIRVINTLRLFPFKLKVLAKTLGLEESKGEIDYDTVRPIGYEPTDDEVEYLRTDVVIAGKALKMNLDNGNDRITIGSNSLKSYKKMTGKKFDKWFPLISDEEDDFLRDAYRGGWTYANPKHKDKDIGKGSVYDVNSLYPSRMRYCPMPYGEGIKYVGRYEDDEKHPLYVQRLSCSFKLKKGKYPMVQLHNTFGFGRSEYVESTDGECVELTLTSVDLRLFKESYDVKDVVYVGGYKYKASLGMFDAYIDYWMNEKIEAEKTHDRARRTIAKLMLNNLYGKFAKRKKGRSKYPELQEDDSLKLVLGDEEDQGGLYLPVGVFITAYARDLTIRSALACGDRFLYSDTDSIHVIGWEEVKGIEVDATELGKWKRESDFIRARYLGAKCYIEDIVRNREDIIKFLRENPTSYYQANMDNGTIVEVKCAGMPDNLKAKVRYEDFAYGLVLDGKLVQKHVPNGIMLAKTTFEIKKR